MSWLRLDDSMVDHAKVAALSDRAFRLHIEGMSWVSRNLSDGVIPAGAARRLHGTPKFVAELVAGGLWHEVEAGFEIHDYLDYNPSRDEVEELRAKRSEAGREGGKRSKPPSKTEAKPEANASGKRKQMLSKTEAKQEPPVPIPHTVEPSGSTVAANPLWDAMEAIFLYRPIGSEAKLWGSLCRDYRDMGLSGGDVLEASRLYDREMPTVEKTPTALRKHAQRLLAQPGKHKQTMSPRDLLDLGAQLGRNGDSASPRRGEGRLPELGPAA